MEDLSKLDQLELLDLRMRINNELQNYDNRAKVKAYGIFVYDEWQTYLKREHAIEELKSIIEDGDVLFLDDDEVKIAIKYIDKTYFELCKDWYKVKGEEEFKR